MNAERRRRVEQVFLEATAVREPERIALIEARCADDAEVAAEVRSLLERHDEDTSFLNHAELTGMLGAGRSEPDELALPPGTRVAGFTIGAVLGTGGMGVVYVAEQDRPRRTVALKVIRPGRRGMLKRFEHEAEILGRLKHPGIAQVYEAGAADLSAAGGASAQPYIAMELVKGAPLDEYARRARLDVRRRMEVVALVCDAVQHAHQRGIVHRDLKPANILVDEAAIDGENGIGQPKVLDFGVARATGADVRETMQTGAGQLIGTLSYMSPEQVTADPAEVDTRTDVYALGVVLYQLLTGRLPHALDGKPLAEAVRLIREEEPARAGTIDRSLRGEVETIVSKALTKDRLRRYQSAAELGQDIRRYLEGRPIAAKDDSAFYVLRKQLRRHSAMVGAAVAFVALLAGFAVYASVQSRRNERSARSEEKAKVEALESLKAAKEARQRADDAAAKLRTELTTSTVERGRLLAHAGNLAAAEALLWPAFLRDPGSRQTHWALWELYAHQPCVATVAAHDGSATGLALSPDGGTVYSAGGDGVVRCWDRASARAMGELAGSAGSVIDLTISPDGLWLATASADGQAVVWDVKAKAERLRIAAHRGAARGVAFSPDGKRLVTCGNDGLVRLWDASTGEHVGDMPGEPIGELSCVVWSADGAWLACAAWQGEGRILLWDGKATSLPRTLGTHRGGVGCLAWTRDGVMLASGGNDREIQLWDVRGRTPIDRLRAPNGLISSVHFTADGSTLLSTGYWTMDVWDVATRRRRRSFSLRANAPASLITPDGSLALAAMSDGTVQFWEAAPSPGIVRLGGHSGRVAGVLSADGQVAATGDAEGVVRLWDAASGELLAAIRAHNSRVKSLRFSPDGRILVTGAEEGVVRLWDLATGEPMGSVDRFFPTTDDSVSFNPDGRLLAVVRRGSAVSVLRMPDLSEERTLPAQSAGVVGARFTPDGRTLAVVYRDHVIRLWPMANDAPPRELATGADVIPWSISFSLDGSTMAVGNWAKEVQIWDLAAGMIEKRLRGHAGVVASLEFSRADRALLASTGAEGAVRLWDAESGAALATLEAFDGWDALSLSWSRDGRRLLATSAVEGVIWDLAYFDHHIARNADDQVRRLTAESGDAGLRPELVRAWAADVLDRAEDDGSAGAAEQIRRWKKPKP